jgi:hypothetical protein
MYDARSGPLNCSSSGSRLLASLLPYQPGYDTYSNT